MVVAHDNNKRSRLFCLFINFRMKLVAALLGGMAAILCSVAATLWSQLPAVVGILVSLDRPNPGLARLKLAHDMAGGPSQPDADEAIADAIKAVTLSKVLGPHTSAQLRGVPSQARTAWRLLLKTLQHAEGAYLSPSMGVGLGPPDNAAIETAEGLRFISHVARLGMEVYLERSPRFVRMVSPTLKLLGDNPDALYYIAVVDSTRSYLITGCRGEEVYFSFSIHAQPEGSSFPRVVAVSTPESLTSTQSAWHSLPFCRHTSTYRAAHSLSPTLPGRPLPSNAQHIPGHKRQRAELRRVWLFLYSHRDR